MSPRAGTVGSRRRPSKGDLTSQAILDTAERLLQTRSLDDIAVDELASGAGISRSTFYFHFASREAVLHALAGGVVDELYESASSWLRRGSEPPEDSIRRALGASLALWRKHGPVLRAAVRARDTDPSMREFWSGVARRFVDATASQIELERAAGVAPPGPPAKSLAAVLVSLNEQAFLGRSRSRRSAARDRELVDTLTCVWLRSVYGIAG
ncbi:TetR family transcriptional regulator [Saccharothrix saharensis]|uniref:TetR family transcriptional regulator n=1 Tax=Saccharothrix saharensis TaxID=571190 RepID=A0A543JM85_9PSEU|nr:TetR/AcrR family transcriptional regulator [Saccharothrix saharensis]TQM83951.1 TetR family transcriptional regulator [Saccharothrix saharensis]